MRIGLQQRKRMRVRDRLPRLAVMFRRRPEVHEMADADRAVALAVVVALIPEAFPGGDERRTIRAELDRHSYPIVLPRRGICKDGRARVRRALPLPLTENLDVAAVQRAARRVPGPADR